MDVAAYDGVVTAFFVDACGLWCAAEGEVRAVDAGRAVDYGDLTRIVSEDDGIALGAGVVDGLLIAGGDGLGIGTSTETNGLPDGGAVSRFLRSLPGSGERAGIGVRP